MSGILIYTSSSDSEGTLGGLSRQADLNRFKNIFLNAIKSKQKKVNNIRSGAMRLASELQGGGVRQGSFYPPTKTHLKRFDQLLDLWEEYQVSNE